MRRGQYLWVAVVVACIAVGGFARTYYLGFWFHAPGLTPLVHVHGAVMTLWCLGFMVQTFLVAAGRVRLHQQFGIWMTVLAAIVVVLGEWLTIAAVAREGKAHTVGKFHFLLGINSVNLLLFVGLIVLGFWYRQQPDWHKRFMALAALTLLAPAIARIVLLVSHKPLYQFLAFYGCFLLCVAIDTIRNRRLHPVFAMGTLAIITAFQGSFYLVQTNAWMKMVQGIFG
jgi:hypothetical protein